MFAAGKGQIVRELSGLGLSNTCLVAANGGEARTGTEIEGGKCVRKRMLADVHTFKTELLERACAFNGKIDAGGDIGKAITELVQKTLAGGGSVGDQQAAVVNAVN